MNIIFELPKNIKRYFSYYLLYTLIFVILHLIFVSVATSFHFMLEHKLSTIEEWISRHSWELTLISKMLSFHLTTKILNYLFHTGNPLYDYFRLSKLKPNSMTMIMIFTCYLVFLFPGGISKSEVILESSRHQILSYWGTTFFYFLDFLLIAYIRFLYPAEKTFKLELLQVFFFASVCYFGTIVVVDYNKHNSHLIFFTMLTIMSLYCFVNDSWLDVALFLFFFVAPLSSYFGLDLIWGDYYSPYKLNNDKLFLSTTALIMVFSFYIRRQYKLGHLTIASPL